MQKSPPMDQCRVGADVLCSTRFKNWDDDFRRIFFFSDGFTTPGRSKAAIFLSGILIFPVVDPISWVSLHHPSGGGFRTHRVRSPKIRSHMWAVCCDQPLLMMSSGGWNPPLHILGDSHNPRIPRCFIPFRRRREGSVHHRIWSHLAQKPLKVDGACHKKCLFYAWKMIER